MPIRVNLKEIFPSDPQEINVDKVNFNFNKLLELGIGTPGPLGLTGPQGPAGPIGLTGPQGSRGATWWVDAGDPNLHTFTGLIDGDLYLDTITFNAWQYDDITLVWTQIASISAIVNAYLTSISAGLSPFKRGIGVSTGTISDKYVVFRDRGSDFAQYSADVSRGLTNNSTNLVLLLNNFDEETLRTALTLPNLPLNFPNPNTIYDALLKIVVSHAASGSANVLGRYHAEYGSLYENSITGFTELSELKHNLKVKFLKNDVSLNPAYLPSTNTWINTAHYSLSSPDGFPALPDQNGIFEFITPKYNNEGGSPITDSIYVRFGPAESHVEIGIDFQHIVADGITISSSYPTSLNSTFGIAPNYISLSNAKLDTKHHIMIDANSLLNGVVLLNKGLHVEGDANIVDGLAVGVAYQALTAPVDGAIIAGDVGIGIAVPTKTLHVSGDANIETGLAVGTAYSSITAPVDGAIFSGDVGIGTSAPAAKVHIINGGQGIKLATGTNTLGYTLSVGINDDGVNFSTDSSGITGKGFIFIGGNALPSTTGTAQTKGLRLSTDTGVAVLDMGVNSGSGQTWIQSTDSTNLSSSADLLLNPNAGTVGIGTTSPDPVSTLHANGKVKITDGTESIGSGAVLTSDGTGMSSWTHSVPVGAIMMWPGSLPPTGWVLCDGSSSAPYPVLAAFLSSATLPDLRGAFIVGAGTGGAYSDSQNYVLGANGGAAAVILTTAQLPAHNHTASFAGTALGAHSHDATSVDSAGGSGSGGFRVSVTGVTGTTAPQGTLTTADSAGVPAGTVTVNNSTGGGGSHENRPPYFALNYIIKY